jgi:hypothetical protein
MVEVICDNLLLNSVLGIVVSATITLVHLRTANMPPIDLPHIRKQTDAIEYAGLEPPGTSSSYKATCCYRNKSSKNKMAACDKERHDYQHQIASLVLNTKYGATPRSHR